MNTRSFFKWGGMFQGGETDWQSIWVGSIPIFSTVVKAWSFIMKIMAIIIKLQMEGKEITFQNSLKLAKEFPDDIIPERKAAMVMSYWNDYNERWKI